MKERFNSLSILKKKEKFNSLRHFEKNKGFNSLSHVEKRLQLFESSWKIIKKKKCSILWVILKNSFVWVFFWKKNSILWVIIKAVRFFHLFFLIGSFLWVIFKKIKFFESYSKKRFNSLSHTQKEVQFIESYSLKKVQPFESNSKTHNSLSQIEEKKRFNSLSHMGTQEKLNSWSHTAKRLQLFESYWEEVHKKRFNSMSHFKRVQFFESYKRKIKSLRHIQRKRVQFFESYSKKKISSLRHFKKMKERLNSLRHFEEKDFNSLSNIGKQEKFNSLSQKERLQLFEPSWKEVQFDESSHISWKQVQFRERHTKKVQYFESYQRKKWNPLSRIGEFQFFESYSKKSSMSNKKVIFKKKTSSILWVVCFLQKQSSVSRIRTWKNFILRVTMKKRINSSSHFFGKKNILKRRFKSVSHKKSNSLSFVEKKGFNSSSHIEKNLWVILKKSSVLWIVFLRQAQFFECFFSKKIQFFESHSKKFNSLSHAPEISILWVIFFLKKKKFSSSSHVKEGSIHLVMFKKVQFFESFFWKEFNFRVFFEKEVTFKKWVRFFESYLKKESSILWVILQKEEGSILLVTLKKTILWVKLKEGSILWVRKKTTQIEKVHKRGSILWVVYKEFNPLSHFSERRFRFFESVFFDTRFNSLNHISEKRRGSIL